MKNPTQAKPINPPPGPTPFGTNIRLLAAGVGIRPELAIAYLSSVLGGIAGPFARIGGFLGEHHSPAIPLVLATAHPGRARHLAQFAIEPAARLNDNRRLRSSLFIPDRYRSHLNSVGSLADFHHREILSHAHRELPFDEEEAPPQPELRRLRQHHQPSVMITGLDPKTFDAARGSVCDDAPLVVDTGGMLVRHSIQPNARQADWQNLLNRIVEGARGGMDQPVPDTGLPRLDRSQRTWSPFLIHLPIELTGQALLHPASANLFEVGILLPTATAPERLLDSLVSFKQGKEAADNYRHSLRSVIWNRMERSGIVVDLQEPSAELRRGTETVEQWIDGQPSEVRRYCGGLYELPLRLLWTLVVLEDSFRRPIQALVSEAVAAAHWCARQQVNLIKRALNEERERQIREAAATMIDKLRGLPVPCKLADLVRRYHRQNRDYHLPTLDWLQSQGAIEWNSETNQIRLLQSAQVIHSSDQASQPNP